MSRRLSGPCLVCGNSAVGINFSVPTCAPCKAFFRRNAVKLGSVDFVCQADGDCPVTYEFRRGCNCCRLAKCFRVGMQKSLIRSEAEKEARKDLVQQNREKRMQLKTNKQIDNIGPSNLFLSTHSQSKCLSLSDQTLLTNIFSGYERTYMTAIDKQCPYFPCKIHLSLHTLFNEYGGRHMALMEFMKLIPEFNSISLNDRIRLMRNNFGTMIVINESSRRPDEHYFILALQNVYGTELSMALCRCTGLIQAYTHDPILTKLLLIVGSLSNSNNKNRFDIDMNGIYDNTQAIFAAQNVYVEILWRYILSRLPSEIHAVKLFNKIILDFLSIIRLSSMMNSFVYNSPDEIDKTGILMQSMWPRSNELMTLDIQKLT